MSTPIFKIADVLRSEQGMVLAGCHDSLDHLVEADLAAAIGERISIHLPGGEVRAGVLGVQCSSSLVGKKNVFILLAECEASAEWIGNWVFAG